MTAEINATIKKVIPDHSRLPVKKKTSNAATLSMLEKHGHHAKIDLREAKRVLNETAE